MFSLYKKELQSYFLSPIAYFVIAFFMATFSLTFIQEIGNVSSSTYTFSFSSIFYVNIFYFIFLLPLLTMRTFSEERKNGTETMLLISALLELIRMIALWQPARTSQPSTSSAMRQV